MANLRGFFRPSAGPGWALVGDAGHFKDPTPGQGIADAFRQSEKLAAAITRALGGGHGVPDEILREWWRWRDEDAWEMYWLAHDMGAAVPITPLDHETWRRIAADPELTAALVRTFNHDLRPSELITPAFALTTVTQAMRHGRGRRRAIMRNARTATVNEFRRRRAGRRPLGNASRAGSDLLRRATRATCVRLAGSLGRPSVRGRSPGPSGRLRGDPAR